LTPSQRQAVEARGNVLVMAGAGTGKTRTLVARCLDCLERDWDATDAELRIDKLLIVTFTEAAAAEMRQRLRKSLEAKLVAEPENPLWPRELAGIELASIGTLHSFCLRLVREHFHELELDPQLAILGEGEARQLAGETLDELFQAHYAGADEFSRAVQTLVQIHGDGRDDKIRALVLRLHNYSQTRPNAAGWLAAQLQKFSAAEPADWEGWLLAAITDWCVEWLPVLENLRAGNEKAAELAGMLQRLTKDCPRELAAEILAAVAAADATATYPKGKAGKLRPALGNIFEEGAFLASLATVKNGNDPLVEDWSWVRGHMATQLRLAQEFAGNFARRKRADGVIDFHDLEQFALRLLWDFATEKPTAVAAAWRAKLRFVFVDEYQDINAAQDKIIAALAGEGVSGNRFLVGDVKQSIYRFRLADPKIFRDYSKAWRGASGQVIALSENFRSREGILNFANSVFSLVLREEIGGVAYDDEARLKFGQRWGERPREVLTHGHHSAPVREDARPTSVAPRVELLLRTKTKAGESSEDEAGGLADLDETTKEARLIAMRLQQLVAEAHEVWDEEQKVLRPAQFRDMAVLLRSPRGKSEVYAKEFERAGVALSVVRGGFFESAEVLDLLSLLQLLDNPLQDVPCIAVLRSPLVGLSLDELAEIRLAAKEKHFWTALNFVQSLKSEVQSPAAVKISKFLKRFSSWRQLAKQHSLSECLEAVLAETLYAGWVRAQPRGAQRAANIENFLNLAAAFDQFQRQGLFRFLKFIEAQAAVGTEPDAPGVAAENAVRLMSIHQSKGLEFPIVALPDLAKPFNEQDLHGEIIFDEAFGLCPKVKPPSSGRRYPSLPHWLAQRRQKRELRGEELRLLYVALTRARDTLVLSATITEKKWETLWTEPAPVTVQKIAAAKSFADWLGLWFSVQSPESRVQGLTRGELPHLSWRLVDDAELECGWGERPCEPLTIDNSNGSRGHLPHQIESLDAAALEKLRVMLSWEYPKELATKRKAKASVTELRRAAEELDDEAEPVFVRSQTPPPNRKFKITDRQLSAAEYGTAHHKFLQHVDLDKTGNLAAEAERLVRENYLSAPERAALDLDALGEFWSSELGRKICANAKAVRRELPFTARFSPAEVEEITGTRTNGSLAGEFIVVQGAADLVVLLPQEIWLVDFKTDTVSPAEIADRVKTYRPQLKFYAAALAKIFSRQVTRRALHFLAVRRTEEV